LPHHFLHIVTLFDGATHFSFEHGGIITAANIVACFVLHDGDPPDKIKRETVATTRVATFPNPPPPRTAYSRTWLAILADRGSRRAAGRVPVRCLFESCVMS
jgi:hypothetical protein